MQIETLFTLDEQGRPLAHNGPQGARAPRFFLSRTATQQVCCFRADVPAPTAARLRQLAAEAPGTAADPPDAAWVRALRGALAADTPVQSWYAGPCYYAPSPVAEQGETVQVHADNAAALLRNFPDIARALQEQRPCFAAVDEGRAVAVCYSSRRGTRAAEAGVNTLPAFRRRGLAAAVTAAWARATAAEGLLPLYSTSWENAASQGVARALGLRFYAAELHLT
jgi:hypothetical protein